MAQPSCIRAIQPLQQPLGLRLEPSPWTHTRPHSWTHSSDLLLDPLPDPLPAGTHRPGPTPAGLMPYGNHRDHYHGTHSPGPHAGTLLGPTPGPTSGPILGPTTGPILEAHDPLPAPLPAIEPPLQSQDQHLDPLPNSPRTPSNSFPSSTLGLLVSDILGLLWSNHYMKLVRVSQSHYHNHPAGDQLKSQRHDHSG
jgi:hypothetical protein